MAKIKTTPREYVETHQWKRDPNISINTAEDKVSKGLGLTIGVMDQLITGSILTPAGDLNVLNSGWRLMLLQRQARSRKASGGRNITQDTNTVTETQIIEQHHNAQTSSDNKDSRDTNTYAEREIIKTHKDPTRAHPYGTVVKDVDYGTRRQSIINDSRGAEYANDVYIVNISSSPEQAIKLQNRPNEIDFNPAATWAVVKSMGRNNPFYMYTGGEDTIKIDISWYAANKDDRADVIKKCKLLESWTRANGYESGPPILHLIWGKSDIFKNQDFILDSAPYRLTHFQDKAIVTKWEVANGESTPSPSKVIDLKLYPNFATQSLTFKRISSTNRTHLDIISDQELKDLKVNTPVPNLYL